MWRECAILARNPRLRGMEPGKSSSAVALATGRRCFIIGCDSRLTIHLAPVTAEPNAAAYRVQTKFPWAIPDFEIVGSLLDTAVPEGYLLGILQI